MRRAEWTAAGDDALVGVVGRTDALEDGFEFESESVPESESPSEFFDGFESTVDDHGGTVVAGCARTVLERSPSLVVCVGETAMSDVVRVDGGVSVPVLPVELGDGVRSVSLARLPDAIDAVLEGDARVRSLPVLRVESAAGIGIDGSGSTERLDLEDVGSETETGNGDDDENGRSQTDRRRALFEVTLVTEEPARISEYSVTSRGERLAQFRADGVVAATPQGSHGYASAAGGPLVSSGLEAVAVVPIAPFVTQTRQWILPDDRLELAVERDEGPVSLQLDDRTLGRVPAGSPVSVTADESLAVLVPDERS